MAEVPDSVSNGDCQPIPTSTTTTHANFSNPPATSFVSAHPGARDCPPAACLTRTLSRQTSFDHGGEGSLSSTQVKQRLRAYVLNRRRRVPPVERYRRAEEKFNTSLPAPPNLLLSSPHEHLLEGTRYWHSADSANSKEDSLIHELDSRHDSLDLPSNTDYPHPLHLGARRSSAADALLPSHRSYLGSTTEDQAIVDAIERLTGHLDLKESNVNAQLKDSLLNRLRMAAGLGTTDIRKTLSESNLLENSWPLRQLLPHLLLDKAWLENQQNSSPQRGSDRSTTAVPTPPPSLIPRRHSLDYRTLQSTTTPIGCLSGSRPVALEPLLEPPFVMDSSGSSGERAESKGTTTPGQHSLRFPIGAHHGTQDNTTLSALTAEAKIKAYLSALPSSVTLKPPEDLLPSQLPDSSSYQCVSSPTDDTDEVAMDWETESDSQQGGDKPCPTSTDSQLLACRAVAFSSPILNRWIRLPVETWSYESSDIDEASPTDPDCRPTALAFDPEMLEHRCLCAKASDLATHPESPERMRAVLERLLDTFLRIPANIQLRPTDLLHMLRAAVAVENPSLQQELMQLTDWNPTMLQELLSRIPLIGFCRLVRARMATEEELCAFHSKDHVVSFGNLHTPLLEPSLLLSLLNPSAAGPDTEPAEAVKKLMQRLCKLNCGGLGVDSDTVWNPVSTSRAARLAVGQVLCLATKVIKNELRNGFALIRPPGHHAEPGQAMGFCYFNSVAVTALNLLRSGLAARVLILDWDIHHGNGTKLAALQHPGLLYISIHRYDGGKFFPGTGSANEDPVSPKHGGWGATEAGDAPTAPTGRSQMINIAWETPPQSGVNSTVLSMLDAVDRREIWRQSCERQRLFNKASSRPGVASTHSSDTSSGSMYPTAVSACQCRLDTNGHLRNSQLCSLCLSQSIRSSLASSIHSGSSFPHDSSGSSSMATVDEARSVGPGILNQRLHAPEPATTSQHRPLLGLGDAEYLAAMRCVVIPVGHEFKPDIILISAGFDAALGHGEALGGYSVSPGLFAWITRQCMSLANNRVVLALEGGYQPVVVSECITNCLNALLLPTPASKWVPYLGDGTTNTSSDPAGIVPEAYLDAFHNASDWIPKLELDRAPRPEAVSNLLCTIRHQAKSGWRCLESVRSQNVAMSFSEAIALEQRVTMQHLDGVLSSAETDSHHSCASPLTNGIAQLRMDHH